MKIAEQIVRADALTDALRAMQNIIGDADVQPQMLEAIRAIKALRAGYEVRVQTAERVDYLDRVQHVARTAWGEAYGGNGMRIDTEASGSVQTPLGALTATVWRQETSAGTQWKAHYSLDGKPISVRDIKLAGLAQRPTSRNRGRKIT